MEEKDSLMMSFPSIPPNFISLQKLQQLRLEEKEEVKKKKQEEEEERERCLKENQNKVLHQVTDIPISSSNGFYYNQKKWKNELQIKGGRNTVEPAVYSEKSKKKSKEKEISKPTTCNGSYNNKKKCHKIRERRKEEVGFFKVLEPVDSKKQKKSKDDKEKQENQEKLSEDGSISSKGEKEMGLGLKSSQEIDLEKEEKKKKRRERNKKMKEERLRKKLNRQQKTLVDENGGDVKEIKSMEVKDQISVNPTVEIVVDDESKKMKVEEEEEEEEINGGHQLWRRRRKKKSPIIRNVVAATTVLSNPTAEIVRNINVVRVVGDDQKGKNRRSMVGMNRGFGGGFGNGRNAKGRNRDNDEKNLMWVKKGETMNSTGGNAF